MTSRRDSPKPASFNQCGKTTSQMWDLLDRIFDLGLGPPEPVLVYVGPPEEEPKPEKGEDGPS